MLAFLYWASNIRFKIHTPAPKQAKYIEQSFKLIKQNPSPLVVLKE